MNYGSRPESANPNPVLIAARRLLEGRKDSALAGYASSMADQIRSSDSFDVDARIHGATVLKRIARFAKFMVRDRALAPAEVEGFAEPEEGLAVTVEDLDGLIGLDFSDPLGADLVLHNVKSVETMWYWNIDGEFVRLEIEAEFEYGLGSDQEIIIDRFVLWIPADEDEAMDTSDFTSGLDRYAFIEPGMMDAVFRRIQPKLDAGLF